MNANPSPDGLDHLLGDFFKSQLKKPWPPAPSTAKSEPSSLVARTKLGDHSTRARLTLAASVALVLGTCWFLTNDSRPNTRVNNKPSSGPSIDLNDGSAGNPEALKHLKKDNATKPDTKPMDMKDVFEK